MRNSFRLVKRAFLMMCLGFFIIPVYGQQRMKIGQKAPQIQVRTWLKGVPVKEFATGKVYVIEFWATWCKPCIELMPELSDLARKYKGKVEVIGINILDHSPEAKIAAFVINMGDKMEYSVALDDGTMRENWFLPSGSRGIPVSFVIDQRGSVAWYGNNGLEEAVAKVVKGESVTSFTDEANPSTPGITEYLFMPESESILKASEKLNAYIRNKEYKKVLLMYERLSNDSAQVARGVFSLYFEALINENPQQAFTVYKNLIQQKDRWQYWISWIVVHKMNLDKEFYLLAKALLEPASVDRAWSGQTLVREGLPEAYYRLGEKSQAVILLQKWIDELKQIEGGEMLVKTAESRLKTYNENL